MGYAIELLTPIGAILTHWQLNILILLLQTPGADVLSCSTRFDLHFRKALLEMWKAISKRKPVVFFDFFLVFIWTIQSLFLGRGIILAVGPLQVPLLLSNRGLMFPRGENRTVGANLLLPKQLQWTKFCGASTKNCVWSVTSNYAIWLVSGLADWCVCCEVSSQTRPIHL